jgi:hypothetical protein
MKNYSTRLLSLFFISLNLFISCKKDNLPKATEKGKNTFGCKIDGKIFVPQKTITYPSMPPLRSYYDDSSRYFELSVSEDRDEGNNGLKRYMILKLYNLKIGNNALNENNKALIVISTNNQLDQRYETNTAIGGTLNITRIDTLAHIISGTFSFNAASRPDNSKIISVTDGRFDINYK